MWEGKSSQLQTSPSVGIAAPYIWTEFLSLQALHTHYSVFHLIITNNPMRQPGSLIFILQKPILEVKQLVHLGYLTLSALLPNTHTHTHTHTHSIC